jgi:hypothetical protein
MKKTTLFKSSQQLTFNKFALAVRKHHTFVAEITIIKYISV